MSQSDKHDPEIERMIAELQAYPRAKGPPMTAQSETPHTNNRVHVGVLHIEGGWFTPQPEEWVKADDARVLERELAAMTAARDGEKAAHERSVQWYQSELAAEREAHAETQRIREEAEEAVYGARAGRRQAEDDYRRAADDLQEERAARERAEARVRELEAALQQPDSGKGSE